MSLFTNGLIAPISMLQHGLRAANKLTNKHINYGNVRMNVKLTIQTLSESIYKSFIFLLITR